MSHEYTNKGRGGGRNNWRNQGRGGAVAGSSNIRPQNRFGSNNKSRYNGIVIDEHIQEACPEDLRIAIDKTFKMFLEDSEEDVYIFPSDLNNLQRKYIHWKAQRMNLISKSYGKEPNRKLHLTKKAKDLTGNRIDLYPSTQIVDIISHYDSLYGDADTSRGDYVTIRMAEKVSGRLQDAPVVPPFTSMTPRIRELRKNLPISPQKCIILDAINNNQVIIVSSETGSGKTTQIPQYILEDANAKKRRVKIICTQPRRISTVAAAERVAFERGEKVGNTVGYQIRLESKCGPQSSLIYCTVGVFLRNLMCGSNCLEKVTHIIVDEIHERDKLSDFLLICLRQNLSSYSHLKIILMSATIDVDKFKGYFQTSAVLSIPGRLYDVHSLFLEDALKMTGYMSMQMRTAFEKLKAKEKMENTSNECSLETTEAEIELPEDWEHIDQALEDYLNFSEAYDYTWHYEQATADLMQCFISEDVSVDYKHSKRGLTALMIAAHLGDLQFVSKLVNMGAKLELADALGRTAIDYAKMSNRSEMPEILEYLKSERSTPKKCDESDAEFLGKLYDMTTPDDFFDYNLIVHLVSYIMSHSNDGSILVFLPGYEEIMQCSTSIQSCEDLPQNYRIFFLHSSMNMRDQCEVFEPLNGIRKIILATNIAETSITVEDVVFVIDSGKAKEKTYDSYSKISALQTQWISRACAKQRQGRAGRCRPGMCLKLFTSQRYQHMTEERIPEILRVSLEELCLNAKTIAPDDMNIFDFLSLAPDPPSANSVKVAIESLQFLGALGKEEELTKLGEYLSQLTVEPKFGKMVIYGTIFRCLDPLLTLAACMAHKDPFQLPAQANLKSRALEMRRELLGAVQSDHFLYLIAFQKWQEESQKGRARQFCSNYFISESTMSSVLKTRKQLLGQLKGFGFLPDNVPVERFNVHSNNWGLLKAIMSSSLYPNIAFPIQHGLALATKYEKKVSVDNRSACIRKAFHHWLIYDEVVKHKVKCVLRGATAFTPFMMSLMCGADPIYPTPRSINLDDWIEFAFTNEHIVKFRKAIDCCIDLALSNPSKFFENLEKPLVNALQKVMEIEHTSSELEGPSCLYTKNARAATKTGGSSRGPLSTNGYWRKPQQSNFSQNNYSNQNIYSSQRNYSSQHNYSSPQNYPSQNNSGQYYYHTPQSFNSNNYYGPPNRRRGKTHGSGTSTRYGNHGRNEGGSYEVI